ncbi:MAG: MBL fold metallo-hydrolase [Proteobacteria bacterium]|nr:MBL fold metallo-hydrolase [Pseudomonadota bacterium]
MRFRRLLAASLVALSLGGTGTAAPAREFGPAPRDSEGRYLNLDGPIDRGPWSVRVGFGLRFLTGLFRQRGPSPEVVPNDGAWLRANAAGEVPAVTWIGHATLLVQMSGLTFLTDPTWSKRASPVAWAGPRRHVPPGVAFDELPPIDFVLISHNHYDHLDVPTLRRLARRSPSTRFIVPAGNAELLRKHGISNLTELDWGESLRLGQAELHCLPARHWSSRGLTDAREALWASWAVTGPDRRFYFGGDTGWFDGFARIGRTLGPFDLAALPIGAYEPAAMMRPVHLDPEEAAAAARELRAKRALGIHFGTFELTTEPFDEPPRRFRASATAAGLDSDRTWVLKIGETRPF